MKTENDNSEDQRSFPFPDRDQLDRFSDAHEGPKEPEPVVVTLPAGVNPMSGRAALQLLERWGLPAADQVELLGGEEEAELRIELLLSIHRSASQLFPDDEERPWIKRWTFDGGRRPIDVMLTGIEGMERVLNHLERQVQSYGGDY